VSLRAPRVDRVLLIRIAKCAVVAQLRRNNQRFAHASCARTTARAPAGPARGLQRSRGRSGGFATALRGKLRAFQLRLTARTSSTAASLTSARCDLRVGCRRSSSKVERADCCSDAVDSRADRCRRVRRPSQHTDASCRNRATRARTLRTFSTLRPRHRDLRAADASASDRAADVERSSRARRRRGPADRTGPADGNGRSKGATVSVIRANHIRPFNNPPFRQAPPGDESRRGRPRREERQRTACAKTPSGSREAPDRDRSRASSPLCSSAARGPSGVFTYGQERWRGVHPDGQRLAREREGERA